MWYIATNRREACQDTITLCSYVNPLLSAAADSYVKTLLDQYFFDFTLKFLQCNSTTCISSSNPSSFFVIFVLNWVANPREVLDVQMNRSADRSSWCSLPHNIRPAEDSWSFSYEIHLFLCRSGLIYIDALQKFLLPFPCPSKFD